MFSEYELISSIPKRPIESKPVIIVQARMGSTRLPGKVMRLFHGKPMLQLLLERLLTLKERVSCVLATTTEGRDDVLVSVANGVGIPVVRGSESDVLSRYAKAVATTDADTVVRITADCPLTDPLMIDRALDLFYQIKVDYLSNSLRRTYPRGFDTEVCTRKALEIAAAEAIDPYDREHVTPYIIRHEQFRRACFVTTPDLSAWRLTVDTQADYALIERLSPELSSHFSYGEVCQVLALHPEWKIMNT